MALFFSHGVSLEDWDRLGLFDREAGYYQALAPSLKQLLFVTYDRPGPHLEPLLDRLRPVQALWNRWRLPYQVYGLAAPLLHRKMLRHCDILKTNQLSGAWTAAIAARLFRKPLIVRCGFVGSRARVEAGARGLRHRCGMFLEKYCLKAATVIFVATENDRHYLSTTYGVPADRFRIIPTPIDTDLFCPDRMAAPTRGKVVYVGRLSEEKNVSLLINACRNVPGLKLVLAGSGPLEPELRKQAEGIGVEFLGAVPNGKLTPLLNSAEVFVLCSRYEGCPKALLEAMSCSAAVVGTRVRGIRDVIRDRENGLLCDETAESLAAAISELLASAALRRQLGEAARRHIEQNYSQTAVLAAEIQVLDSLLKREGTQ